MNIHRIAVSLFCAAVAFCCGRQSAAAEPKPNVLLICVDDLKPLLGCYGDKVIKSPNIDRLAARGVVFERAYCNQAVCAPSRNSLMTGVRPTTLGIYDLGTNFREAVPNINFYLQEWGAVGFRAGFMFHDLDWLRDLAIEYDASTFDTDPFEPQPEGVGTIFPFWVEGHAPGQGYVELPYTLPQDSTMFLIFRDEAIDVWKTKLDWLAANGGMALLNVHPDYLAFDRPQPNIS